MLGRVVEERLGEDRLGGGLEEKLPRRDRLIEFVCVHLEGRVVGVRAAEEDTSYGVGIKPTSRAADTFSLNSTKLTDAAMPSHGQSCLSACAKNSRSSVSQAW